MLVEKEKVTGDEFRTLFDPKVREEILGIAENTEPETEAAVQEEKETATLSKEKEEPREENE